jgi:hypothetical protein
VAQWRNILNVHSGQHKGFLQTRRIKASPAELEARNTCDRRIFTNNEREGTRQGRTTLNMMYIWKTIRRDERQHFGSSFWPGRKCIATSIAPVSTFLYHPMSPTQCSKMRYDKIQVMHIGIALFVCTVVEQRWTIIVTIVHIIT